MGFFDKKYCDVCGDKIGLLGNRKLEDGNLCKNCAKKLSPWFDERRHSTVEQIKKQLAYREENQTKAAAFNCSRTFGKGSTKLYIDDGARKFAVHRGSDFASGNPDILDFSQAVGCDLDIRENRREMKRTVDGKSVSYNPPRYEYSYDFKVTVRVNHPYFDDMAFDLNGSSVHTGETRMTNNNSAWHFSSNSMNYSQQRGVDAYHELVQMGNDLKSTIDSWRNGGYQAAAPGMNGYAAPAMSGFVTQAASGYGALPVNMAAPKEIRFGSSSPVPYRDNSLGSPVSLSVTFIGAARASVADPALVQNNGGMEALENVLRTDLVSRILPMVMQCSKQGIPFAQLPAQTAEISNTVKQMLAPDWLQCYGLNLEAVNVQGFSLTNESKAMYEQMRSAAMQQPVQQPVQQTAAGAWTCTYCGAQNTGKFCTSCGAKKE